MLERERQERKIKSLERDNKSYEKKKREKPRKRVKINEVISKILE